METTKYCIDQLYDYGCSALKYAISGIAPTSVITKLVNTLGRILGPAGGSFTVMGKIEFALKIIKMIFTKEIARVTLKGAVTFGGHVIGIAADIAQWILEWYGYQKTGKAVGLLGNIAGCALVGGMSGGPIGAVVGGTGGAVIWGATELIGWLFS